MCISSENNPCIFLPTKSHSTAPAIRHCHFRLVEAVGISAWWMLRAADGWMLLEGDCWACSEPTDPHRFCNASPEFLRGRPPLMQWQCHRLCLAIYCRSFQICHARFCAPVEAIITVSGIFSLPCFKRSNYFITRCMYMQISNNYSEYYPA